MILRFYAITNHLFFSIKAFFSLIKRVKDPTKNNYIKVKNPVASCKLWGIFLSIYAHICQETRLKALFAGSMKVYIECDQQFMEYDLHNN